MKLLAYIGSVTLVAGSAALFGIPQAAAQSSDAAKAPTAATMPDCSDPNVNTAACKREKAAAAHAKSKGKLTTKGEEQYQANALKRCERQPEGPARDSCRERVMGKGNTTTTGSVKGGGTLSTNEITVPAGSPKN
jgi:hypothetical protein